MKKIKNFFIDLVFVVGVITLILLAMCNITTQRLIMDWGKLFAWLGIFIFCCLCWYVAGYIFFTFTAQQMNIKIKQPPQYIDYTLPSWVKPYDHTLVKCDCGRLCEKDVGLCDICIDKKLMRMSISLDKDFGQ